MSARWALPLFLGLIAGCGNPSAPVPTADAAKSALQAGLDAWKAGRPASSLAEQTPKIEMIDFEWRAKAALMDFQIKGDATGQGTQTLAATITLKGKPPKDVTYHVLGTESIQIYRDEDFQRAMNMDNNPAPKARSK